MADLFHLDEELNHPHVEAEEEEQEVIDSAVSSVDDADVDREIIDLPPALVRAAKQKTVEPSSLEDDRLDLQDFAAHGNLQESDEYSRLQHWWVQELQAPELLPWDAEIINPMLEAAFSEEDEGQNDGTDNLEAILNDIRRVDKERVQFIVANLLQTRLRKIQACPWYYVDQKGLLSRAEVNRIENWMFFLKLRLQMLFDLTAFHDAIPGIFSKRLQTIAGEAPADFRHGPLSSGSVETFG